jgi:hypothetical protein
MDGALVSVELHDPKLYQYPISGLQQYFTFGLLNLSLVSFINIKFEVVKGERMQNI